ncbi:hypothetical protein EJD97_015140 [Solanum chilense]|uniref:MADS-box domain-containing protein n=1 Tax=Solanum chilense TaxID=4083 RepID=A0A6N2B8B2_SOLCI|nr:hypothetical protein EJD97_015140 [Solanum chilense]
MATKRLRDTRNYSENARNSILDRRVTSLFKKVEELSNLCDIEVAIIIFKPGSVQPIAWKSASLAQDVLTRINERKEHLKQPLNPPSNNENVILPASPTGDLLNDSWFFETMASLGYGSGIGYGSGTSSAPTKDNDTNVGDNGHSKDLD